MNSILEEIAFKKRKQFKGKKVDSIRAEAESVLKKTEAKSFIKAVHPKDKINIIAEIKKAAPSSGIIREDLDVAKTAKEYEEGGASAISVLTEREHFLGDLSHLKLVSETVSLPVLRKDFIVSEYELYEAKVYGADAALLIAAILEKQELTGMLELLDVLGLDALVEVHNEKDLEKALKADAGIIGINNRNLDSFQIDKNTALRLFPLIPKEIIAVCESGIQSPDDIKRFADAGMRNFLVGSYLMKSADRKAALKNMISVL